MGLAQVLDWGIGVEKVDYFAFPAPGSGEGEEEEDQHFGDKDNEENGVDDVEHANVGIIYPNK